MARETHTHFHEAQKQEWAKKFAFSVALLAVSSGMTYLMSKTLNLEELMGGDSSDAASLSPVVERILAARGVHDLTPAERRMASTLVDPETISTTLDSIGGLADQIDLVWRSVVVPLQFADAFHANNCLARPPRGVLLQGQPGTGKTLMAKAIAKEGGAHMFNVSLANLEHKYFGESSKNVRALYSLADRLAPSVVFIDELDGLMRTRTGDEQSFVYGLKTELMATIDGLESSTRPVITVAATNTSRSIDAAFKRRLPLVIRFELPDERARATILRISCAAQHLALSDEQLAALAALTPGASGSDLSEVVRLVLDERQKLLLADDAFRARLLAGEPLELPAATDAMLDAAVDRWAAAKDVGCMRDI